MQVIIGENRLKNCKSRQTESWAVLSHLINSVSSLEETYSCSLLFIIPVYSLSLGCFISISLSLLHHPLPRNKIGLLTLDGLLGGLYEIPVAKVSLPATE